MNVTSSSLTMTDVAKIFGIQRKTLIEWLQQHRWIFKRRDSNIWSAYQSHVQSKELVVVPREVISATGTVRLVPQVRITAVGLYALQQHIIAT